MSRKTKLTRWVGDILGCALAFVIFIIPFLFMFLNSLKDRAGANKRELSLPDVWHFENYLEVLQSNHYQVLTAFKNSAVITLFTVIGLVIAGSMAGYVIARRSDKKMKWIGGYFTLGLMLPAAILPSIWILQGLHIFKTLFGLIMIEVALNLPFTIMLYQGFICTVPVELEESGYLDGCGRLQLFFKIIMPLLKPVTATICIINAVGIFNDFTNPLYFLPGAENVTVQLTLYNYLSMYASEYHLLFADVLLITIPMLVVFLLFNKQIVSGMTVGAVKG
ncbi:MAG TPA: carbohydrate ABC transporter permease [Candidatus Blautia faecavium]|uniref:Carbohydrate ABC transporter permease n=1 Tax=Candidatus Blautia faecavium TaxID=2838487 RepID=A0A9D2LV63_9FIRM|nr:carbohydrate ABC transporter permease [Candidatus Blautia faecavium]